MSDNPEAAIILQIATRHQQHEYKHWTKLLKLTHTPIWRSFVLATLLCALAACVYQVDVQQGNKLEPQDVEAIKVGMTRNQVRFLLGTPVVSDLFRDDRWDYMYYFRKGKSETPDRRWLIVWFDGDIVKEVDKDVQVQPT